LAFLPTLPSWGFLADDRAAGARVVRLAATDVTRLSISALEHLSHPSVRGGWINLCADADIQLLIRD
jgi:hypothetical protein